MPRDSKLTYALPPSLRATLSQAHVPTCNQPYVLSTTLTYQRLLPLRPTCSQDHIRSTNISTCHASPSSRTYLQPTVCAMHHTHTSVYHLYVPRDSKLSYPRLSSLRATLPHTQVPIVDPLYVLHTKRTYATCTTSTTMHPQAHVLTRCLPH
ncbi:hypothetical protein Pcinc_016952 [Petrolisthes cinctipes]|uniref:Uncharacterized protein n=1 Tax=Petrolisthes cinctipes TaxID=88211 RepID=A0AAE1FQ06_PETCI|nr:hypothetical protein Pcinc_016952 [Petrolisthes cinctipes]